MTTAEIAGSSETLERYHRVVAHAGQQPNHLLDKSALYQRLKAGGEPLVLPPPLSHSYPWYEVVEDAERQPILPPQELAAHEGFLGRSGIVIHQDVWTLLERLGENDMRLTYPGWDALGFTWRVWLERVPVEQAGATLCCHHDPAVGNITTPEQIDAEARYHAQRHYDRLKLLASLPLDEAIEVIAAEYAAKSPSESGGSKLRMGFSHTSARYEAERYAKQLAARRAEGLDDLPSAEELESRVIKVRERLLSHGWEVADGKLWHWSWFIQRQTPAQLSAEHYLAI